MPQAGNLVQEFLVSYFSIKRKFIYGQDDCTLGMIAEWVRQRTGCDIAAPIRSKYASADEARSFVQSEGGFVAIADRLLSSHDIQRTDDPMTGDVGVIVDDDGEEKLALRLRNLWCARTYRGYAARPMDHIAAWRIP